MTVRRIIANIATPDPQKARCFYGEVLGPEIVMDHGWIVTFADDGQATPQVSFASEGGGGAPVPDLSVEVDDVDEAYSRATAAGFEIVRELADEPWGVRRFFVRDPFGRIVNILAH